MRKPYVWHNDCYLLSSWGIMRGEEPAQGIRREEEALVRLMRRLQEEGTV